MCIYIHIKHIYFYTYIFACVSVYVCLCVNGVRTVEIENARAGCEIEFAFETFAKTINKLLRC